MSYFVCLRNQSRSTGWKIAATLSAVVFTIAYIGFENIARYFVDRLGYNEFWLAFTGFPGFLGCILWHGPARHQR